jgi:adenine phosphoribosyltransferase
MVKSLIRTIPHYPKEGVMFRDITTLLKSGPGFGQLIHDLSERYSGQRVDKVVGIEARGFILGAALAFRLGVGFVPVRKKGKLPGEAISCTYSLEYGSDCVELHKDAIEREEKVILVDNLIATGGTAEASASLIQELGGTIIECCFAVELPELGGRRRLEGLGLGVYAYCDFEGE